MAETLSERYPNPLLYQEITTDAVTAVKLTSGQPEAARRAVVQPSVAVRAREDNVDPTAAVGLRLVADTIIELDEYELERIRFINEAGAGKLRVTYFGS